MYFLECIQGEDAIYIVSKFMKIKPLYGKRLPILFLIVVPFIYTLNLVFLNFYAGIFYKYEFILVFREFYAENQQFFLLGMFGILFIGYGLYPYTFSGKRYFKKIRRF